MIRRDQEDKQLGDVIEAEFSKHRSIYGSGRWNNAPMESFFMKLETELLRKKRFKTKAKTIQEVLIYIEIFNNRKRIHSVLGGRSLAEFEAAGRI